MEESLFQDSTKSDVDHLRRLIQQEYVADFMGDSSTPFTAFLRNCEEEYLDVDTGSAMDMVSLCILDFALESEKEYRDTFWLEAIRVLISYQLQERVKRGLKIILNSFIQTLMKFNDDFPRTLPSIFHYEIELHRAADFWYKRGELNKDMYDYIKQIGISVKFDLFRG